MQMMDFLENLPLKDMRFVHRVILECIIAQPCFSLPAIKRNSLFQALRSLEQAS